MRLLKLDEAIKATWKDTGYTDPLNVMTEIRDRLKALPTVDAVPVVHSEWIPKEKADTPYGLEMECAKCGFSVIVNVALYFKFCPNCGAKMDEDGGDNETD